MVLNGCKKLVLALVFWLFLPTVAFADGNIAITVSYPGARVGENHEGNMVNSVLSTPTVTYGDDRVLGTLRITGKKDICVPLAPGNKIMVTLPPGLCYMQTPTADNYKNYVEWPYELDGLKNQIQDAGDKPGVKFVSGTPRSLTIEINNIDSTGKITVLEFVFNKTAYSSTRVSRLLGIIKGLENDSNGKVTRLEFFEMLADITVPFPSCPLKLKDNDTALSERFFDLANTDYDEIDKIKPLIDSGLIVGFQNMLEPDNFITRAQAANAIGSLFPHDDNKPGFKDDLPEWATGINAASARGIVVGYPDGTFRPDQYITKSEALIMLQKTLESYQGFILTAGGGEL